MQPLTLLVAVLACYRLTLLVVADEITAPTRQQLREALEAAGHNRVSYALTCPWCVSPWLAPAVVGSALAWGESWWWWLAAGSLAASAVTGALATVARP